MMTTANARSFDHDGATLSLLLRSPQEVARRCLSDEDMRRIVRVSLLCIVLGGAVFGGVIGSFRGGIQILYAALKIPFAVIATLAICAPAFYGLASAFGRAWPFRTVVALTLASAGRASLLLLAFAPLLWLAYDLGLGYHSAALAATLAYGLAGLSALGILLRGLGERTGKLWTAVAFAAVFFAVFGQTSWALRPYLVRPRTEDVPFLRAREGSFTDAIVRSARSSVGIYDRVAASSSRDWEEEGPGPYHGPYTEPYQRGSVGYEVRRREAGHPSSPEPAQASDQGEGWR